LYSFYKYELPYSEEQEQMVIDKFIETDRSLIRFNEMASAVFENFVGNATYCRENHRLNKRDFVTVARRARILLARLFARFDPKDIYPRHGPGAVATKQRLWNKYLWRNVSANITSVYPFDEYYCSSMGHVCDSYDRFHTVSEEDLPARVILVPKDSRGPRLISCEPVDYQWIQQGLGRAITDHVEHTPLTMWNVFYTNQSPNQCGALLGSMLGKYSTLDLNEASDRVSTGLVRLLFPEHLYKCLMACRSSSTVLPDGTVLKLNKFAPMGSSLCFPVMSLCVWSILTAAAQDADTRERILVYGDDVIVPTAFAGDAIEQLESFGLKVNRDKSCTSGFFRESCGTDAFKGINVTPVRFRTVWSSSRSPNSYTSWIAYANSLWDKKYYASYEYIVDGLLRLYGEIPDKDMCLTCPSLASVPDSHKPQRRRVNKSLQKLQWRVRDVVTPRLDYSIDGWSMLLRYFTEKCDLSRRPNLEQNADAHLYAQPYSSVSSYTRRDASKLVYRWR
jgi:hypothetical protein